MFQIQTNIQVSITQYLIASQIQIATQLAMPHDDIAIVYPKSEITLVLASENKITVVPVKSYSNTDTLKLYILRFNKAKAGVYRWTHKESAKS